jgi:hypothetical protein
MYITAQPNEGYHRTDNRWVSLQITEFTQHSLVLLGKKHGVSTFGISALEWVDGQYHALAVLTQGRTQDPLHRSLGGLRDPLEGTEVLVSAGIRFPDRQ